MVNPRPELMQRHEAIMDMKYYFNILQRILIIWREGSKGRFGVKLIYFRGGYAKKTHAQL